MSTKSLFSFASKATCSNLRVENPQSYFLDLISMYRPCLFKGFMKIEDPFQSPVSFVVVFLGDPSRYHSFYIVVCLEDDEELSPLDIVTMGRLGANVRKTVLLASLDDKDDVRYTSLQWTGLS